MKNIIHKTKTHDMSPYWRVSKEGGPLQAQDQHNTLMQVDAEHVRWQLFPHFQVLLLEVFQWACFQENELECF